MDNQSKKHKGSEHEIEFVKAREDAAEAFEPAEEPFDFVAAALTLPGQEACDVKRAGFPLGKQQAGWR